MASTQSVKPRQVATQARRAANAPWVEEAARVGYIARGAIYLIMGLLALGLALPQKQQATDQTGAIAMLTGLPYGKFVLLLLGIGLLAYALWGVVRAVFDPLHEGTDPKGLLKRASYLFSGLTYGTLALVAFYYGFGVGLSKAGTPQDMSAQLLKQPFGQFLTLAFGILWIAIGFSQFYAAYKASFQQDLHLHERNATEHNFALILGRFGYAARGVIFVLIGWFLIQAARTYNPAQAQGFDGALLKLNGAPYGELLFGVVALGLVAFGVFSILCARWLTVPKS